MIVWFLYFIVLLLRGSGSLFKTGLGDAPVVKAFRAGYRGEDIPCRYKVEVINSMGCQETLYSDDKVNWFSSQGEFRSRSFDGGKTMLLQ